MHNKEDVTKKTNNSVYEIWQEFISENSDFKSRQQPIPFYFCDNEYDANDCANLVIKKVKQATAASLWWYEKTNEKLPEIGDINIITDWNGKAKAIIETTKIEKVRYHEITPEFAKIEGEGDKSLEYWKDVHWNYYSREMKAHNEKPTNNMIIVCEYFKTIMDKELKLLTTYKVNMVLPVKH